MVAAINNKQDIARLLIVNEADKALKDNSGVTAGQLAEKYRSVTVSNILNH